MQIDSPDFENGDNIPKRFTCDGENINPHLEYENIPGTAVSLALIIDDSDAPGGTWTHWVVWNINPRSKEILEGGIPEDAVEGLNSSGNNDYEGPCPPPGEPHHYHFKLYALDADFNLSPESDADELRQEMINHVIEESELVGLYQRG